LHSTGFYVSHKNMARSISDRQKKRGRGRPATGIRPLISFRLSEEETARLDAWGEQRGMRSRSDAIRAMITEALDREPRGRGKRR
jgi:Ribbon-helix-helix protein, copG family